MGGGDLNLKKSWHTGLLSNQRKVWEAEQQALSERKMIEQVRREREEERQMEEIARLAEESGGPKKQQRVDWMYTGASAGAGGTTEEQEAFLLGKRRVDTILKREDAKQLENAPIVQQDPAKDIASKVALDPLLLVERQKQEALEKAMAIQANIEKRKRKREGRDRDSRSRKHREHGSSRSYRDRSRERRSDSKERHRRHRRDDRSRSRDRDHKHSRDDRNRSREREDKRHQREQSCSDERVDRHHRKERSHSIDHDHRRRRSYSGDRSRSPKPRRGSPSRRDDRGRTYDKPNVSRSNGRSYDRRDHQIQNQPEPNNRDRDLEEVRQAKLAAMQADASNLESDRSRRLDAMEQRDAEEKEREERKRDRGVNFKSALYQQTESIGLEERLKNSRRSQLSA